MKNTKIEWCDHTFNCWIGCTKVSPGCAHCYAETLMDKRMGRATWGPGQPRQRTSAAYWREPLKWDREARQVADAQARYSMTPPARPRVFCASLADWLDDEVPIEWLSDLLDLIRRTPHLDWLLLTKRPQDWRRRLDSVLGYVEMLPEEAPRHALSEWGFDWYDGKPPANVWVGTSVEDQARANERIPQLLAIPAKVRFLSMEPLLGPVDLLRVDAKGFGGHAGHKVDCIRKGYWTKDLFFVNHSDMHTKFGPLHWVIVGGESGSHARPMHPDWARSLRDQRKADGVAFFMKQMGGQKKPFPEIPEDLKIYEYPI